jgi:hypothetical protein
MIGGSMIGVQCEVGRLVQMANGLVRGFAWSEVSDLSVEELALGDEVLESIASDFDGHIDTISTEASNADFDIALVQLRVRQLTERANIHSCGNLSPN